MVIPPVTETGPLKFDELSVANLFDKNKPSVVCITNLAGMQHILRLGVSVVPQVSGAGFIWDKEGHILTNCHVIGEAPNLMVTLANGKICGAKVVGFDPDKDVAVLLVDPRKNKLRPITIGVSRYLRAGQNVYAIGHPFGLRNSLTTGTISGLDREISSPVNGEPIQDVIQTDAAINPGNSGGPLLDSSGRLIGINTAIYSASGVSCGVGFSIPVDTVAGVVDQVMKHTAGVILGSEFAPDQSVKQLAVGGLLVLHAAANGPAGKAGLLPIKGDAEGRLILGDIITSVGGKKVTNGSDLSGILDQCKEGYEVIVEVFRGGRREKIAVILEPKPDESSNAHYLA